ncbi:MAG: PQQ-binding-like beta-propeller repeat protein [Gemmatimonadaceae bacterium]
MNWLCATALIVATPIALSAQSVDWPMFGGTPDNTHYSTLGQITPANVASLKVAWTYETKDEWKGSEMQTNPVIIDGILYGTSPKLRVFALDATTGKELWSFDPNPGKPAPQRFRHRGLVVTGDRVLVTYRYRLYALDRKTGLPITSFGDSAGFVDMRNAYDRPPERVSVSASTPGVVYGDLYIIGSTVAEALPSTPGDIRAYEVKTGKLRWTFHTIPRPGEFGYDTWPADAWKVAGGANAWAGVTVDQTRGLVFAATGSASFDFYGANRLGDNLFANSVIALDAKTGKRRWHFQTIKHDLWDWDLPAAPTLVTVRRDGRDVDAVAQITKTGYVYVLDRVTGTPLFPLEYRKVPASTMDGEKASEIQPFPLAPPPFIRQHFTEDIVTRRTPSARDSVMKLLHAYDPTGMYVPPGTRGSIIFPGVDGGGEWGGPAFDPATGLLYVNANEMPWYHKLVETGDKSLFEASCAGCHGANRTGAARGPSLAGIGTRMSREQIVQTIREGTGNMPAFAGTFDNATINNLVNYLITGKDIAVELGTNPNVLRYRSSGLQILLDPDGYPPITPPWGTLNAIDLNAGEIKWSVPLGEYPALAAQGMKNTGTDNYGGAIVTENGLLFIGATTYDKKFRVFDKRTGALLWETMLPAAGNATPSMYMVNGKQYIVIACGGGKNDAPSGGTYVAFALP